MIVPFLFFLIIVILFRSELGLLGVIIAVAISLGSLIACVLLGLQLWFTVIQAIIDIVLVVILFGDVRSY
jgi:hypothetical protein